MASLLLTDLVTDLVTESVTDLVTDLVTRSVTSSVTSSVTLAVTLSVTLSTIPSLRLHMVFNSSLFSQGLADISSHFRGDVQCIHGLVDIQP